MQLELFQWDGIIIARGYTSLALLDFEEARTLFDRELAASTSHPAAQNGLEDLQYWEETFRKLAGMDNEQGACFLWERIRGFPFDRSRGDEYVQLRSAMIRRVLERIGDPAVWYSPPDLCAGYLYLLLGEYGAAEVHLQEHVNRFPKNGRLHSYLGDALFMQGKVDISAKVYAAALLLTPQDISIQELKNRRLVKIIEAHGSELAPVYGYLAGILPLVSLNREPGTRKEKIYQCLRRAEYALRTGDHGEKVAARRTMKKLDAAVFGDYMTWLQQEAGYLAGDGSFHS